MNTFRIFLTVVLLLLAATDSPSAGRVGADCSWKGRPLHGKVRVVAHFPDIKVKVVKNFPDLKVQKVSHFPDKCGKWQVVNSFPDFTIQYVDHFPDFTIQFVDHFPGLP